MLKILCIYVVLIPTIVWDSHFEVPKVFALILASVPILFYLLLNLDKLILVKRDKWYLTWLFWLTASSLIGENFKISILGGSYRHQGIIFFFCLWLFLKVLEFLKESEKLILYKIVAISVTAQAIIVMLGYKLGTIGEINAVSGFISIGIYFAINFLPKWMIGLPILSMILNFSKSGFLALIPYVYSKKRIIPILLFILLIFIFKPINLDSNFENRAVIWKHSTNLIIESPVFGYGAESNEVIFKKAFAESGFPLSNLIIDRAHNLFLDVTLWSGSIGLVLFLGFLYHSFENLDINRKKALFSFLIFSMLQPLSVAHWLLFILII